MNGQERDLGEYELSLTRSHRATLLAIVIALLAGSIILFVPVPTNVEVAVLALCGGLPIAANYLTQQDLFAPAGFLGLGYLITVFGPALDFAVFGPDDSVLLLGNGVEYLIVPLLVVVIYVGSLMTGLTVAEARHRQQPRDRRWRLSQRWHHGRARKIGVLLWLFGLTWFLVLVNTTGGIPASITELSAKRRPPTNYINWGAQFLMLGAIFLFTDYLESSSERRRFAGLLFAVSVLPALMLPVYTSQRSTLLIFVIALLVVAYYRLEWLTGSRLGTLIPVGIVASNTMLVFRKASWQGREVLDTGKIFGLESFVGFFEASRGGLATHAHLIHQVPHEIGYRFGATLFAWTVFPIPRAFWHGKPKNLGQQLGVLVYGRGGGIVGAGTPPFLAGELYLNFDLLGVILGGLMLGLVVGTVAAYLNPSTDSGPIEVIIYAVFVTQFVFGLMRGDLSPTMVGFLRWIIVFVPCIIYITSGFRADARTSSDDKVSRSPGAD